MSQQKRHEVTIHGEVTFYSANSGLGLSGPIHLTMTIDLGELDHLSQFAAREQIRNILLGSLMSRAPTIRIFHLDTIDALLAERRTPCDGDHPEPLCLDPACWRRSPKHGLAEERGRFARCGCCQRRTISHPDGGEPGVCPDCHDGKCSP